MAASPPVWLPAADLPDSSVGQQRNGHTDRRKQSVLPKPSRAWKRRQTAPPSAVGQDAAGEALDVAGFRDGRMHRMIRALGAALQQLDVAVQVPGALQQDVLQVLL